MDTTKNTFFRQALLAWYKPDQRPLPWKGIKNPYHIWLSEIILQQTRVEQGLPYYEKFVEHYPTVKDLATAEDDQVMKHWEGLGYYSRARNMLAAARTIHTLYHGEFPNNYKDILSLKGVGTYTAAAIASFAFDLPHAVLDGNVYRVLSRFFGIDSPTDSSAGKKIFTALAEDCLDKISPAIYNQAIMDFGATLCKPKNPACHHCPLRSDCKALETGQVAILPLKAKKIKKRKRYFYYLQLEREDGVLLEKRSGKDIWKGLYQFPIIETEKVLEDTGALKNYALWQELSAGVDFNVQQVSKPFSQTLTHQYITAFFIKIKVSDSSFEHTKPYFWHPKAEIRQFAFPKVIDWYLGDNSLYLNL